MRTIVTFLLVVASAMLVAGCGQKKAATDNAGPRVTGTIMSLQRTALPADAEVHVALEDVSIEDAPARLIAEQTFATEGKQVPISYSLEYDPSQIIDVRTYSMRAEILSGGKRLFASAISYPVLTHGAGKEVDIVVQPTTAPKAAAPAGAPLVGTYWKLTEVAGRPAIVGQTGREPHLTLLDEEHRLAATGGCNQLGGAYDLQGNALTFSALVSTKMMCQDVMEQEDALSHAFESTKTFRIRGNKLELMDGAGTVVARFEAAAVVDESRPGM